MGIELRHFAALDAIASERSFRGAASRLGYVQSAVSRQIAFLEQMTGARLIERSQGPRPVHLTDAGQLLLSHANDILASIGAAKTDLSRLAGSRTAEVRVGVFPGVPSRILPHALMSFAKRHPRMRVVASEAATDAPFFEWLQAGTVDLAFVHLPLEEGPFEASEIVRVPWVLVVPAGSELATRGTAPTAADIARLPLIGANSARMRASVEGQLRTAVGAPRIVFRSDVPETAQALAAEGVGAAVVPRLAVMEGDPRTVLIELDDLVPPLAIGLAWQRNRRLSTATEEFRDLVRWVGTSMSRANGRRFIRERANVPTAAES